jgi:hypothetical protein
VRFINPYAEPNAPPSEHVCQPVAFPQIEKMVNSVTYNSYFGKYLLVGITGKWDPVRGVVVWGVYYSTSTDLVNWSDRQLLMEGSPGWICQGTENQIAYSSLLDANSSSRNYETTGKTAYLYFTRFNWPCTAPGTLDRDLIRIPIEFLP